MWRSSKAAAFACRSSSMGKVFIDFLGHSCKEVSATTCELTPTTANCDLQAANRSRSTPQHHHYTLPRESRANGLLRSSRFPTHSHKSIHMFGEPHRVLCLSSGCAWGFRGFSKWRRYDQHADCCCLSTGTASFRTEADLGGGLSACS